MKQFSTVQKQLLAYLADGQCHSGSTIGVELGISRTAVWKQINTLNELGLSIQRLAHLGYQLAQPFQPLNETLIRQQLGNNSPTVDIHLFSEIDSTNRFLKEQAHSSTLTICCAEKQTHGRGRFGRYWASPFGENIYFSGRWELNCCLSTLSGLSLVVSLAILQSFKKNNISADIAIKWPNDLLWQDKKLAGVLIEIIAESNSHIAVIIGIGINVNSHSEQHLSDKPWCSLYEITGCYFDRNQLIATLINSLDQTLQEFLCGTFVAFQQQWQQYDYLAGKYITVSQPTGSISGYAQGVTTQGELCLQDIDGNTHYLSAGDTSLAGN